MKSRLPFVFSFCLISTLALAQTTQPAEEGGRRIVRFFDRVREVLAQVNLTDDQKQKVDDILSQARRDFQAKLPELRDATPEQRRQMVRDILEKMRQQIADLLTPDQKIKFQHEMEKLRAENQADSAERPPRQRIVTTGPAIKRELRIAPPATEKTENEQSPASVHSDSIPQVGDLAPDFSLRWLNGDPAKLSAFKGKPVVLIFGSYTTPTFRDKAVQLPKLAQRYSTQAKFILVYTKEAHPSDGWTVERNKHDNIDIPQPTDEFARKTVALQAVAVLHLENLPLALDTMNDATADAYDAFPDGVVIIGKDGKIAARENWLDPTALPRLIDQAVKN